MEDKEFLGYFEILSKRAVNENVKKQVVESVEKIVKTLQVVSHRKQMGENKQTSSAFVSIFGDRVIEDLDWTIKRCIRGGGQSTDTHVQIHNALALKEILVKFGASIKIENLIDFIVEEVAKKNAVSRSEVKHFGMGRLALFKGVVQSQVIEKHCDNSQQIYENLYELLEQEMDNYPENVLDVCEDIFAQKQLQKQKAKLYFQHIVKNQLKHHTGVSMRALIIDHFAHKNNSNAIFAQQSFLDDKLNNIKNFKSILNDLKESYPQEHTAIKSLIDYLRSTYKKDSQWTDFWRTLLKDFCLEQDTNAQAKETVATDTAVDKESNGLANYRNYFVTLALLRRFLKLKDFTARDFKAIAVEELLHLWIRHFSVKNETMRLFSVKIEKSFIKTLTRLSSSELSAEERKHIVEVIYLLRGKTTLKFSPRQALPKAIFSFLNAQETSEYLVFLRKQLHKTSSFINDYLFYLNEMYVCAEFNFIRNSAQFEHDFYDICYHLFENSTPSKLALLHAKQNSDAQAELALVPFVKRHSDHITSLFTSLLSSTLKLPSFNFKDQKSSIWRGLNSKNELWIFNILKYILKKADNFANNLQLTHTMKELNEFVEMANNLEHEVNSNLEKKIDEQKGFSNKKKRAFCNLIVGVCIMSLFHHDEGLQNLDELKEVFEAIQTHYDEKLKSEKPKKKVKISSLEGKETREQEDEHFIRVLTDLLVSLLTKSTHYLRETTNLCFQTFVHEVDQFSLQTLVDVITRPTEEYISDMPNDAEEEDEEDQNQVSNKSDQFEDIDEE